MRFHPLKTGGNEQRTPEEYHRFCRITTSRALCECVTHDNDLSLAKPAEHTHAEFCESIVWVDMHSNRPVPNDRPVRVVQGGSVFDLAQHGE